MPQPTKRTALSSLDKPRLASLVEHFHVDISRSVQGKLIGLIRRY